MGDGQREQHDGRKDDEARLLEPDRLARQRAAGADLPGLLRRDLARHRHLCLNIIGFNMLAQVGWSIPEFIRQLFWLALEPPSPEYGLRMPPLNDGGWYIIASLFLLISVCTWWLGSTARPAAQDGQAHRLGLPRRSGCSWCWACSGRS
jgi:hypothetical protein